MCQMTELHFHFNLKVIWISDVAVLTVNYVAPNLIKLKLFCLSLHLPFWSVNVDFTFQVGRSNKKVKSISQVPLPQISAKKVISDRYWTNKYREKCQKVKKQWQSSLMDSLLCASWLINTIPHQNPSDMEWNTLETSPLVTTETPRA